MPVIQKCRIYTCKVQARIKGLCDIHYDRLVRPRASWTKEDLLTFILQIDRMLSSEWRLNLPQGIVARSLAEVSKDELRNRYKQLVRLLDTRIVPRLRAQAKRAGLGEFVNVKPLERWQKWENLCLTMARMIYSDVVYHPILPNGQIPDFVPIVPGIKMERSRAGSVHVFFAPLIVDAKYTITGAKKEVKDYLPYCKRLEVWFLRWRPEWLEWRDPQVRYLSGHELAILCKQKQRLAMARLLRRLPILWDDYETAGLYERGLDDF